MRAGNRASPILAVAVALTIVAVSCGRGSEDISNPDLSPATTSEIQSNPDPSPATRPDPSPATRPDPSPATRPDPSPATRPDPSPATRPDPSPATRPDPSPATRPDPSPATRPDLSPATRIELQARALSAACFSVSCDTKPVYAYLHAGPDLRAALEDAFGTDVEFLSNQELRDATRSNSTYAHGATLFDVMRRTYLPADGVAAVDIWIEEGFGIGKGTTFLFRWSGAEWEPATPAETGVTVTSAVT